MRTKLYAFIWRTTGHQQIVLCIVTGIVALLSAVPLELQRRIVDDALPHGQLSMLWLLSAAYLVVLMVQGALKYAMNVYRGRMVEEVTRRLRRTVYDRTRPTPGGEHVVHGKEPVDKGALVSIVASEVEEVAGFVGDSIAFPILQAGTAAAVIGYLLWVQPLIAVLAVAIYLPQLVVVPLGQGVINRLAVAYARLVRRIGDLMVEPVATAEGQVAASEQYNGLVNETFHTRVHI